MAEGDLTLGKLWHSFSEGSLREDDFHAQCGKVEWERAGKALHPPWQSLRTLSPKGGCTLLSSHQLQIKPDFGHSMCSVKSALTFPRSLYIHV